MENRHRARVRQFSGTAENPSLRVFGCIDRGGDMRKVMAAFALLASMPGFARFERRGLLLSEDVDIIVHAAAETAALKQ